MLRYLSVENFRSFENEARVDLRPITILLGRNSAGKSSLTRLFPILQQSMERGTSAPILWNSTSIDFGKITDVISRRSIDRGMRISFGFSDEYLESSGDRRPGYRSVEARQDFMFSGAFTAHLGADKAGKTDYRSFELKIDNDVVKVVLKDGVARSVELNGRKILNHSYWSKLVVGSKRLFPYVFFEQSAERDRMSELPGTIELLNEYVERFVAVPPLPKEPRTPARTRNIFGGISYGTHVPFIPRRSLLSVLSSLPNAVAGAFDNEEDVKILGDLIILTFFGQIIEQVGSNLASAFARSSYLGPIRASGNRFYREQELSVEKIDDKGENLATYIGSLTASELQSFNEMMINAFGVEVRPHPDGGHLSIEIGRPDDKHFDNLADVGFGFSQLLPLVAQLHSEGRRSEPWQPRGESRMQITAVEQPELHLHPAYQANLADLFVAAIQTARKRHNDPVIVLETHSEALIGRLGELVAENKIAKEDVAIHFIEKSEHDGASSIRKGTFDSDGFIDNWPIGFFSARR